MKEPEKALELPEESEESKGEPRTAVMEMKKGFPLIDDKKVKFNLDSPTIACFKPTQVQDGVGSQNGIVQITEDEIRIIDGKEGSLIDFKRIDAGVKHSEVDNSGSIFILTKDNKVSAFCSSSLGWYRDTSAGQGSWAPSSAQHIIKSDQVTSQQTGIFGVNYYQK